MRAILPLLTALLFTPPAAADDQPSAERKKEATKRFAKLTDYCQEARVTQVVELLAEWGDCAGKDEQVAVLTMAADIYAGVAGKKVTPDKRPKPQWEVGNRGVLSAYFGGEYDIIPKAPARPETADCSNQVVVASSVLNVRGVANQSVILTNAPLAQFGRGIVDCLVVSSGSVISDDVIHDSTVVCRRDAEFPYRSTAVIRLGGTSTDRDARFPGRKPRRLDKELVREKDTDLLGVKFYTVAEDGLTLEAGKEGATVTKVDEAKPFGKAGVKKGDVIESVDGERAFKMTEIDVLVCRAAVGSGTAKVKVTREKKTEEIEVKLFDWSAYKPAKK